MNPDQNSLVQNASMYTLANIYHEDRVTQLNLPITEYRMTREATTNTHSEQNDENMHNLSDNKIYTMEVSWLRIQIASDLHLELRKMFPKLPVRAEILALCGDIGYPKTQIYREFIQWCSKNYELVFVIAGNHEYWSKKLAMQDIDKHINNICDNFPNVKFLQNQSMIIKSKSTNQHIRVFGGTLWTNLTGHHNIRFMMNDYKKITIRTGEKRFPINTGNITKLHLDTVEHIKTLFNHDIPTIILTHHLPSYNCLHSKCADDDYSPAYASKLETLIKPPIKLWACGHSHDSFDMQINGVRIISNQLGYPGENTGFNYELTIDLDNTTLQ